MPGFWDFVRWFLQTFFLLFLVFLLFPGKAAKKREEELLAFLREAREPRLLRAQIVITSNTPLHEIISHLTSSGCQNLTSRLDALPSGAQPVSRGGFGDVYCRALRDNRMVAIKALRVLLDAEDELNKIPKRAARELYTWSRCDHPNVLPLLGLVEFQGQIQMVSLWLENGSLPSYLDKHPDVDRCSMCVQVCNGLGYLHDIGVVHGDLKGQNILVSDNQLPMITDFGNAVLQQSTLMFTETINGPQFTPRWTAPELMSDGARQSREADVYALGMTVLEIITGKVPYYYKSSVVALFRTILFDKEIPKRPEENIPSNSQHGDVLWSLLQGCWEFEPENRPNATEVAKIMGGVTREGLVPEQGGLE